MQHTTGGCPCQMCPRMLEILCLVWARGGAWLGVCKWRKRYTKVDRVSCPPLDLTDDFGVNLNHPCRRHAELLFFLFTLSYLCFLFYFFGSCTLHSSSTRSVSRSEPIPDGSLLSRGANRADICVRTHSSSGWTLDKSILTVICEKGGFLVTLAWKTYLVSLRASKGYHRDGSGGGGSLGYHGDGRT